LRRLEMLRIDEIKQELLNLRLKTEALRGYL